VKVWVKCLILLFALSRPALAENPADSTAPKPDPNSNAAPAQPIDPALTTGPTVARPHSWFSLPSLTEDERATQINRAFDDNGSQWAAAQKQHLLANFLKNSDGTYSGAVWASSSSGRQPTDTDPGQPDYRFHWVRDSAIAAEALAFLRLSPSITEEEKTQYSGALRAYVEFSRKVQDLPIENEWMVMGQDGIGYFVKEGTQNSFPVRYGEPKYRVVEVTHPDGSKTWEPAAFNDLWGRPQNDSPALRALSMVSAINAFKAENKERAQKGENPRPETAQALQTALVVLQRDLNYLEQRWKLPSYDAWEEVYGDHFFTRVVQAEALAIGAKTLGKAGWGDTEKFTTAAAEVEKSLNDFFDPKENYIRASRNIKMGMRKDSDVDMLVLMGSLRRKRTSPFNAMDPKVMATAAKIYSSFRDDPAFTMNRKPELPGIAVGRYIKDPWTGERRLINPDGSPQSAGHPWIITTMAMGEYFYRVATEIRRDGKVEINHINQGFFELFMGQDFQPAWAEKLKSDPNATITVEQKSEPELFELVRKRIRNRGTEQGARILASGINPNNPTSEQFSGDPTASVISIGAEGLTWNCAVYVKNLRPAFRKATGKSGVQ